MIILKSFTISVKLVTLTHFAPCVMSPKSENIKSYNMSHYYTITSVKSLKLAYYVKIKCKISKKKYF